MSIMTPNNRRRFLQSAAAVSALSYSRVLGANDRIRLGGIGCGGRGRYLLGKALQVGDCEVVAACDVYGPHLRETLELAPKATGFVDYRKLLERSDVDAVMIGSPDHWHVPMTIDAIAAGKDVYVEKPISHTVEEGSRMAKADAASKQIVQVGYQQRSWNHFMRARDFVRSGQLGKVSLILTSWFQTYLAIDPASAKIDTSELDWQRWLGSAPQRAFDASRFIRWRWFWDYGGGHLTDLYSHWGDTLHWIMGVDQPLSAQAAGGRYVFDFQECPDTINAYWEYPGKFAIVYNGTMHCHLDGGNITFRGDRALMKLNRDGFTVFPEGVVEKEKTTYPEPEIRMRSVYDGALEHVRNFLDCVRTRRAPNAPISDAVAIANAAHMANRAYRERRRIEAKA